MNCESARARLVVYVEDDPPLPVQEREDIRDHLAGCPACRDELEALREQIALLRGAGEWARNLAESFELEPPSAGNGTASRPRFPRGGRNKRTASSAKLIWTAAAAAAFVLAFLGWRHLRPDKPGTGNRGDARSAPVHLVAGEVVRNGQPVGIMSAGRRYVVSAREDAEVSLLSDRAKVTFLKGSQFGVPGDFDVRPGLDLLSGKLRCDSKTPLRVKGRRIVATACGRFAMATSAAPPPPPPPAVRPSAQALGDWLFPSACAAESPGADAPRSPVEGFLLDSGWAQLNIAGRDLELTSRQAIIGGDGRPLLQGKPEKLLADMRAKRAELLAGLLSPTYRTVIADYAARRARYLLERAAPDTAEERKLDIRWRLDMVTELLGAHRRRLKELDALEGPRLRQAQRLEARIALLLKLLNGQPGTISAASLAPETAPTDTDGQSPAGEVTARHTTGNGGETK